MTYPPPPIIYEIIVPESPNDGVYQTTYGEVITGKNSPYEIESLRVSNTPDIIKFTLKTRLPLKGLPEHRAKAKRIGWGDIIVRASDGTLYGIRFTGENQGVFKGVRDVNTSHLHFGNRHAPPNSVNEFRGGTLVSRDVKGIQEGDGIAIEFSISSIPEGTLRFSLSQQCNNDSVSGSFEPNSGVGDRPRSYKGYSVLSIIFLNKKGYLGETYEVPLEPPKIPEPKGVLGILVAGLSIFMIKRRKYDV